MERLNRIDGELKRNGGTSMKDAVVRIEKKLEQIDSRLEDGNKRFEKIERTINA
jgi:archaellum component FlaC